MYKFQTGLFLLIFVCLGTEIYAQQSRWYFGFNAGPNISRNYNNDTFPNNFGRRNKVGFTGGFSLGCGINRNVMLHSGINFTSKGYRLSNDTIGAKGVLGRTGYCINIPLGVSFKQQFNGSNFIKENFGFAFNYSFLKDTIKAVNDPANTAYKITEVVQKKAYPMFYLGIEIGGNSETKNRYTFGINYYVSFAKESAVTVNYGKNFAKSFPVNYRGGMLAVTFTYMWNLANFKSQKDPVFYD